MNHAVVPLVSILLPTLNGERFIKRSIESVLAQTNQSWELLVIDDGSTDTTKDIVLGYASTDNRIRYIQNEENIGIQKTLNKGLRLAVGRYIARIDDDDRWIASCKLDRQISFLQENPDHVLVGTGVEIVDETYKTLYSYMLPEDDAAIRKNLLNRNCFAHPSVLFVREAVLAINGYDEKIETLHIEDYDLWLRLGMQGKFHNLKEYATSLMVRASSMSGQHKLLQFKKGIACIKRYKQYYPNFLYAYMKRMMVLVVYRLFLIVPARIRHVLVKFYKEKF